MKTYEQILQYQKEWKQLKRRRLGIPKHGEKPFCKHGHLRTKENLRPNRTDCAICHREQELKRNRLKGALPLITITREQELLNKRRWESKRNAIKKKAFIEDIDPLIVYDRDKGICKICNIPVGNKWEIDHIIPLSRGGNHSYKNVQLSHPECNRKKWANV